MRAYDEWHLNGMIKLHSLLFIDFNEEGTYDVFSMIEKYMSSSPIRAKMDAGDEAAIYSGDKQLMRSADFSDCLPKGDCIVSKEPLRFLSEFYNRLQWETCRSSKNIVEAAPPQEVLCRFYQKGCRAEMESALGYYRVALSKPHEEVELE